MKPKPHQKPLHPGHRQGKAPVTDRCPTSWWMTSPREGHTQRAESHRVRQQRGIVYVNGLEIGGK